MKLAPKAAEQYRSLLLHYAELERLEAILNLRSALRSAIQEIIPSRDDFDSSRLGKRDRAPELMRGKACVAIERHTNLDEFHSLRLGISRSPRKGLPAPRPYPELARHGFLWVKAGAYWFAYHHCVGQPGNSSEITGIFYDRANIPDAV